MDIIEDAQRIMRSYGDIPASEIIRKILREYDMEELIPSQKAFVEHWDNPHVKALTDFLALGKMSLMRMVEC